MKLGATGDFPRGKLNDHDEGAMRIAIGHKDDCVIINFGSPVAWLGLPKANALAFAASIIEHAKALPDDHKTPQ
ncbi:hypothetical protein [Sagittula sp.]|uniref:hypothetical protein n=1 Tax=Sagittula sp. TaxID=2038081 RepID=UPI003511D0EB